MRFIHGKHLSVLYERQIRSGMYKCCCGLVFADIDLENVAVATLLMTSAWKCVCGYCSGHIDFEHVTVAKVLVTSSLNILLWLAFDVFHTFRNNWTSLLWRRFRLKAMSKMK